MTWQLLVVYGDDNPVLRPPVETFDEVLAQAAANRARSDEDGVYWLTVEDGVATVGSFTSSELDAAVKKLRPKAWGRKSAAAKSHEDLVARGNAGTWVAK